VLPFFPGSRGDIYLTAARAQIVDHVGVSNRTESACEANGFMPDSMDDPRPCESPME
jgi:hypothetical protein